jgi:nucleotide-binding universal stress UspA family protein
MKLSRIVAATDFSDDAANAVRRAALLARREGVELELIHVVSRTSLDAVRAWVRAPADCAERLVADARRVLEETAAATGSAATARLVVGDVPDDIASASARALLVLGARGANPLRDAILGTTAERLVGRHDGPILVVRTAPRHDYRKPLVALDLQPGSETGLEAAVSTAPGASLAAVHAFDVPFDGALQRAGVSAPDIEQHRAAAFHRSLDAIRRLSGAVAGEPAAVLPIVERGHAARLILEHQHALGADLIVMGKRKRSAAGSVLLGSTTRHVLSDASCDVLVVPLPG